MSYSREFSTATRDYRSRLGRIAHRSVEQWEDAEDILQETYIKVFRAVKSLVAVRNRPAWLGKVLQNSVRDYRRAHKRKPDTVCLEDAGAAVEGSCVTAAAESALSENELDPRLAAVCRSLPSELLTTLQLYALHELSYREIAETMNVPIGTVMSRLSRAKKLMRSRLQTLPPSI